MTEVNSSLLNKTIPDLKRRTSSTVPFGYELSKEDKLAALAYAHNQGHGKAKSWLKTGKVTKDGFGTPGTKFSDALKAALK